jgi:hypothetical protein
MLIRLIAVLAFVLTANAPSFTLAQPVPAPASTHQRPTKGQIEAAMAAANVNFRQKLKLKRMMDTYKSQIAAAPNEQAKTAATQQLIASAKTVLSPSQQAAFKQSLTNQMAASH